MAKNPYRPLDYLVLPVETLRVITSGLPHQTLGILLQLLIRCAVELNSGRIEHAATSTCAPHGVNIPGLWHWEGEALVIDAYPVEYEAKTISKRLGNSTNAATRWKEPDPESFGKVVSHEMRSHQKNAISHTENMRLHQKNAISHTQNMQLHQKNAHLHPCAPAREYTLNLNHNLISGGVSTREDTPTVRETAHQPTPAAPNTEPDPPAQATFHLSPPPPKNDQEFINWRRTILDTHPSGKRINAIPYDIIISAWQAYQACPTAAEHAALLTAYMASRLQKDKYGHTFYRSTGITRYLDQLPDHLAHAERWAIETGYYRQQRKQNQPTTTTTTTPHHPPPEPPTQDNAPATAEDIATFLQSISHLKDPSTPSIPSNHEHTEPPEPPETAPESPTRHD